MRDSIAPVSFGSASRSVTPSRSPDRPSPGRKDRAHHEAGRLARLAPEGAAVNRAGKPLDVHQWLTPHLTVGHVVFAVATLGYILLATPFEEADLIEELGDAYRSYRARVPAFAPRVFGARVRRR